TRYDVEYTSRQAGIHHGLGEVLRSQRGQLRWFEDHRGAGSDGRRNFTSCHGQREVPRGDQQCWADGLVTHDHGQVAFWRGAEPTVVTDGFFREPAEEFATVGDLTASLGQWLTHFQGHQQGKIFGTFLYKVERATQDFGTLTWSGQGPFGLRFISCCQSFEGIFRVAVLDLQQFFTSGWVIAGQGLARRGVYPFTVNKETGGNPFKQFFFLLCSDSQGYLLSICLADAEVVMHARFLQFNSSFNLTCRCSDE